jgi:hypothetical protein
MLYRKDNGELVELNRMHFRNDREYNENVMKLFEVYKRNSMFSLSPPKRNKSMVKISQIIPSS